jgi:ADP-ribose pyrophosphatase YjhB (NUDIX family)
MQSVPVHDQVSAGGVAFRKNDGQVEIILISVGEARRWQLPKGLINPGEVAEQAALREVREEGGVDAEIISPLEVIEYWYYGGQGVRRRRYHKYVHFYLMRYCSGDPLDHDHEVNEARWWEIENAYRALTFPSEKRVVQKALELLERGV